MNCPKCGKEVTDGGTFCKYCGSSISPRKQVCPKCGKENDEDVRKVFSYILTDVTPKDKELYAPEQIYKDKTYTKKNFPENIKYADMTGLDDVKLKEKLLDAWKY